MFQIKLEVSWHQQFPQSLKNEKSMELASLQSAIQDTDDSKGLTLKALICEKTLRCACAAHTSQLDIKDLIEGISFLEVFMIYQNLMTLKGFVHIKCTFLIARLL